MLKTAVTKLHAKLTQNQSLQIKELIGSPPQKTSFGRLQHLTGKVDVLYSFIKKIYSKLKGKKGRATDFSYLFTAALEAGHNSNQFINQVRVISELKYIGEMVAK